MRFTRRTTLIGLGTLAAGAGVIGGTGAFSSVEANRDFEVSVEGDASALLELAVTDAGEVIAGTESGGAGGNDVLYFELDAAETGSSDPAINEDAVTEFFGVFTVTNNGSQDGVEVTVDTGAASGVTFLAAAARNDGTNNITLDGDRDLSTDGVTLDVGQTATVDLEIDTTANGGYVDPSDNDDVGNVYEMTITAEAPNA